ncbi:MAG: alpha/beta hydrolase [Propionibacteriaceae bacterium]|jgi:pimeloyl-ACP methyl ester carboxylesterase|nr:alpha/beta hydrolase [Propionibacteriaceae bacterium]
MKCVPTLLVLSLLVAGCQSVGPTPSPTVSETATPTASDTASPAGPDRQHLPTKDVELPGFAAAVGGDIAAYAAQGVEWKDCYDPVDRGDAKVQPVCASVLVPYDYAAPGERAITLKMVKVPAQDPSNGTLFMNPGGPGFGGIDIALAYASAFDGYDVIGWNPRGTEDSTPIKCTISDVDAYLELDNSPDDESEKQALLDAAKDFGASCYEGSGEYLAHIGTSDTVRDLDLLRQLAGDAKLNYLGFSYGTSIGGYYTQMFPDTVGRMVLDGATALVKDDETPQAVGFEESLNAFAEWCAQKKCSLGKTAEDVLASVSELLKKLDSGLAVGDRKLTQWQAVAGIAYPLYLGKSGWQDELDALEAAIKGDGKPLLDMADDMNGRDENGEYEQSYFSFPAIVCADENDEGLAAADEEWGETEKLAPVLGRDFELDYVCPTWPVAPAAPLQFTNADSGVLVIGNTGDNATPYPQAEKMAKRIGANLLTYEGQGHTSFASGSTCVDEAVLTYFATGKLPKDGKVCKK